MGGGVHTWRVPGSQDGSPLDEVHEDTEPQLLREAKTEHIENGNDENALVPWGWISLPPFTPQDPHCPSGSALLFPHC